MGHFNPLLEKFMVTEFMVKMSCNCFEEEESAESNIVKMLNESEKVIEQTKKSEANDSLEAALRLKEAQKKELQVLKMMQGLK